MKKIVLTLLLSVSFILTSFAQRNYFQELIGLVEQGRCFDAREFRALYTDKMPKNDEAFDVFYKAQMALFFNKPDSAAIYLEDLIANHTLKIGPVIALYYGKLLSVYDSKQQFREGIRVCDKYLDHLKKNPFDQDKDLISREVSSIEKIKIAFQFRDINEPRIKIVKKDSGKGKTIKINDGEYIRFNARYNNVVAETWINTTSSAYFIMTRRLADKIGTKLINKNQDSVQTIEGIPRKAKVEIIDSIDFESIKLYNIPVLVLSNSLMPGLADTVKAEIKSKVEKEFNREQIMMGVPAMKLLRKIEFDHKKHTVSFPGRAEKIGSNDASNMFLSGNSFCLKLKVNELNFLGYASTGSWDFLNMTFPFYRKNKSRIEIDSVTLKKPINLYTIKGTSFNVPYELVKNAKVSFGGRLVNHNNGQVLVEGESPDNTVYDGVVGVKFFRQLGSKVVLDFDNMRMSVSD